jgi:hypothetical protein
MRTVRPKGPSRNDDTVYDKARVETTKGLEPIQGKSDSGSNKVVAKRPGAKPLPVAKPLEEVGSDKKSVSGPNAAISPAASGPRPVVKPAAKAPAKGASGAVPAVMRGPESDTISQRSVSNTAAQRAVAAKRTRKPNWPLIIGAVGAAALLAIIAALAIFVLR